MEKLGGVWRLLYDGLEMTRQLRRGPRNMEEEKMTCKKGKYDRRLGK